MSKTRVWVPLAVVCALAVGPVLASGFSIYEQSAKASGRAGAWVARADDAAANWYNPAALVRLDDGFQVQFGVNLIPIGRDSDFTVTDPFYMGAIGQAPPATFSGVENLATPINLFFSHKVSDRIAWGVGVTTPFGLITEWEDLPVTLSAKRSELVTFVVNPNVSFALGEQWSVAFGIDYIDAEVKEFSRMAVLVPGNPPALDESDLTGSGDDWGWNFALRWANERWAAGFTYRAELSPSIDGELKFANTPVLNSGGTTSLDLPAQAALAVSWLVDEDFELEFDLAYAGWSSFEELNIKVDNPLVDDIVLEENWSDTYSYRLGGNYAIVEAHNLRFGVVYDEAPVPVETMRPSIPDGDRVGIALGYGYLAEKWGLDFYLMPLFFEDSTANGALANKPGVTDDPDGVIDGTYESTTTLFGLSFNYKF
jgi:long-chain fatty acid transport protein